MRKSIHSRAYRLLLDQLIDARKSAGYTQQKLAEELRKPQSFVAKYENGERRIDVVELCIIARALGIDPVKVVKAINAIDLLSLTSPRC